MKTPSENLSPSASGFARQVGNTGLVSKPSALKKQPGGGRAAKAAAVASAIAWASIDAGAADHVRVQAGDGQSISLDGSDRVTYAGGGGALSASGSGSINAIGTSVNINGGSTYGVDAAAGGRIALTGVTVANFPVGFAAGGLRASGATSSISAEQTTISSVPTRGSQFNAAVSVLDGARATLRGVNITGGMVYAVEVDGAGSLVESHDTSIRNNDTLAGTGYYVLNGGHVTVRGGNIASVGDGFQLGWGGATAEVSDTRIETGIDVVRDEGSRGYGFGFNLNAGDAAVWARNVSITTRGDFASGVWTSDPTAFAQLDNVSMETWGSSADGILNQGGLVAVDGGAITTHGAASNGVTSAGFGAEVGLRNSRISTFGDDAAGIRQANAGKLDVRGSTILTRGRNAPAYVSYVQSPGLGNTAVFADSTLGTHDGPAMVLLGGHHDVTVSGSEITGNSAGGPGLLLWVDDFNGPTNSFNPAGTVLLKSNSSALVGDVEVFSPSAKVSIDLSNKSTLVGAVQRVEKLSLDSTSVWRVRGDSTVGTLANGGSVAFVVPAAGENFKTLTTKNYVGTNGALTFNARLGDSTSPADKLVIDGGTAKGSTRVFVQNAGGLGAQTTGDGIVLVDTLAGGTTEPTAFSKGGRIAAGAYEYELRRGGAANAQAWYLSSTYVPPPPPAPGVPPTDAPGEPLPSPSPLLSPSPTPSPLLSAPPPAPRANYRAEVPVYSALPMLAREYGHALIGTLDDRMGSREPSQATAADGAASRKSWARLVANGGRRTEGDFWRNGSDYRYDLSAVQVGTDLLDTADTDMARDRAGVYGAVGHLSADVRGIDASRAGGQAGMHAYSLGGYWTHRDARGWYTDSVAQATYYRASANTADQRIAPRGLGLVLSGEGGYSFAMAHGVSLTPQVQLIYQHLDFDSANDAYGRVDFGKQRGLLARVGVRLSKAWSDQPNALTTSLYANAWHAGSDKSRATFSTLSGSDAAMLAPSLGGTSSEVGVDVSGQIGPSVFLFARASYRHGLGQQDQTGWSAKAGATFRW